MPMFIIIVVLSRALKVLNKLLKLFMPYLLPITYDTPVQCLCLSQSSGESPLIH